MHYLAALAQAVTTELFGPHTLTGLIMGLYVQVGFLQLKVNKMWDAFGFTKPKGRKK